MAYVSVNRSDAGMKCNVSDIVLKSGQNSKCCDGLFQYDVVELDFGEDSESKQKILNSDARSLFITTQFQTICLADITDMVMKVGGKIGVKFENLFLY